MTGPLYIALEFAEYSKVAYDTLHLINLLTREVARPVLRIDDYKNKSDLKKGFS